MEVNEILTGTLFLNCDLAHSFSWTRGLHLFWLIHAKHLANSQAELDSLPCAYSQRIPGALCNSNCEIRNRRDGKHTEVKMILPIQITFRNMETSRETEEWIRKEATKLDEFYNRIMACRVVVELPSRHRKFGSRYHVRIDLTVPGAELAVKREPSLHRSIQQIGEQKNEKHLEVKAPHRELRQAINDAFKEMARRLQDYARRQRGDVKTHEPAPHARVIKLYPEEGYGFLETPGGREIYFHRNSVLEGGFDHLKVGMAVRFAEEQGEKGPQASSVRPLRSRSLAA